MKDVAQVLSDDDTAKESSRASYDATDGSTVSVSSKVLSYSSVKEAEEVMAGLRDTLADCTKVQETAADGFAYDLTVSSNDDKVVDDTDEQLNALATGTIATGGQSGKVDLNLALVRIDNNITGVTTTTLDATLPGPVSDLVMVVADRLQAVMKGDQPDDTVVAGRS